MADTLDLVARGRLGPPESPGEYRRSSAGRLEEGLWVIAWVNMAGGHIVDARFEVFGSPAALAIADWVAGTVVGGSVDEARQLNARDAVDALALATASGGEALCIEDALAGALASDANGGSDEH